jgi:RNA polymerase sigma factor (sigma-70 family)
MEVRAVPGAALSRGAVTGRLHLVQPATDARLVALVRAGDGAAFEALYERYHPPMLAFCGRMLGDRMEAEDVVQHTFLAAWGDLMRSDKPIRLGPWLFTIARNRSLSILRERQDHPCARLADEADADGPPSIFQRRQELRDVVADLRGLPPAQRSALVLAEIDARSHAEIAAVLDVPPPKVRALVFQARESLLANRTARETDCEDIRRLLSTARGAALRRRNLRRHLRQCSGCREYRA